LQGANLFPSDGYQEMIERYWEKCLALGAAVMVAFAWALGYEDEPEVLLRFTREGFWVCRAIGYPPPPPADWEEGEGCGVS
jgi:isopenicillin N synthase-like dioxygenase